MPEPISGQTNPARPSLSDADYADRGKRLTVRRAQEHQRAKERLKAGGAVKFQTYVPADHEDLIRSLVADLCLMMIEGASPRQILSWRKTAEAKVASARAVEAHVAFPARDDHSHDRPPRHDEAAGEPALRQEQGHYARRRAQWRRAAGRKRAVGLKRIALVVPEALKPAIAVFLAQILSGSSEALLPAPEVVASVSPVPMESRQGVSDFAAASLFDNSLTTQVRAAAEKPAGTVPTKGVGEVSASRVHSPGSLGGLVPQPDAVCSQAVPCWREADCSPDRAGERSPLFDDIKTLDRFPRPGATDSPATAD